MLGNSFQEPSSQLGREGRIGLVTRDDVHGQTHLSTGISICRDDRVAYRWVLANVASISPSSMRNPRTLTW